MIDQCFKFNRCKYSLKFEMNNVVIELCEWISKHKLMLINNKLQLRLLAEAVKVSLITLYFVKAKMCNKLKTQ